jgi:hypothetical protein
LTTQIRLYLEIGAAVVLLIAFGLFVHHERAVGAQKIEASDAKATAAVQALAAAQTQHLQDLSTQAEQAAAHEQQTVDAYSLAHPVGIVRLCNQDQRVPGLPKTSTTAGGTPSAGPGPAPVPTVPASPDIGPNLGELMLDAARLATLHAEWQHR